MAEELEVIPGSAGAPLVERPEVSTARLIFRIAVGGTGLGAEWLTSALRAMDQLPAPTDVPAGPPEADARAVLIGALSMALRWRPAPTRLGAAARSAAGVTRRGLRLFAHAPGVASVEKRYRRLSAGVAAQIQQWGEEGAREAQAGRRLARLATPGFFELAVARLAHSPELQMVIEQQSEGLASASVAGLRERSELADRVVERLVRRVLRRPAANGVAERAPPSPR